MIFPDWTLFNLILYFVLASLALGMGLSEYFGWLTMRYSKFRTAQGLDSRVGMFFLYFIPLLAALGFAFPIWTQLNLVQGLVLGALVVHYAKRCLEVLFVHKYSGPMAWFTTISIGLYYTGVAAGISYLNRWPIPAADFWFWLGLALFMGGAAGNFWQHVLLARLRGSSREYVLPRGGWFEYVVCPHYFFEIVAWLGIVLMSRHFLTGLAWLGMTGYLAARSLKTLAWYREKFPAFPEKRRALIPFLF